MNCLNNIFFVILLQGCFFNCLMSQSKKTYIDRAKSAAAPMIIEKNGRKYYTTTFCISDTGIYVADARFISLLSEKVNAKIYLNSGERGQTAVPVKVLRVDSSSGLALLSVKQNTKNIGLKLGDSNQVLEKMEVAVCYFEFFLFPSSYYGKERKARYTRHIVKSLGINSAGSVDKIEFNKGFSIHNSGGSIVNKKGEVVGIVFSTKPSSKSDKGSSHGIPINKLKTMLKEPLVNINLPEIAYRNRFSPVKLSVKIEPIIKNESDKFSVSLKLYKSKKVVGEYELASVDGKNFNVDFIPQKKQSNKPKLISARIKYEDGQVVGLIESEEIKFNNKSYSFEEIKTIEMKQILDEKIICDVVLYDGSVFKGEMNSSKKIKVTFGKSKTHISKFKNVLRIDFHEEVEHEVNLKYKIIVKNANDTVYVKEAILDMQKGKISSSVGADKSKQKKVVNNKLILPCEINEIVVGGNGRYVIFQLNKDKKLGIFDTLKLKMVKYIPLSSPDVLMAAGLKKIIIVRKDTPAIQIFSLDTFEMEFKGMVPSRSEVRSIAMGSGNDSAFLIHNKRGYFLVDIETMEKIKTNPIQLQRSLSGKYIQMQASSDGHVFGVWNKSSHSGNIGSLSFSGNNAETYYERGSYGHVFPSSDGLYLFSGRSGKFTRQLKPLESYKRKFPTLIPSYHPSFYFSLTSKGKRIKKIEMGIFEIDSVSQLFKIDNLPEMVKPKRTLPRSKLADYKRYMLIPQNNVFITVPYENDRIVIRKFNIKNYLNSNSIDHLYTTSVALGKINSGKLYQYQIHVESDAGDVKYKIESGPRGMKISPSGFITWPANKPTDGQPIIVIIYISNPSGHSIFHTFQIRVN